ncbi:MAG: maltodextrin glucosidase [Acidobacteriota bacterium]
MKLDWTHFVHHDSSPCYVTCEEFAFNAHALLRLRTGRNTAIKRVFVRTCPDGEQAMTPMRQINADTVCQWWEAEIKISMPRTGYRFLLLTDEGGWWFNAAGIMRHNPTDVTDFKLLAHPHTPTWVRDAVFYQIFPDRFADGDPTNNVRNGEYLCYGKPVIARPWGERPRPYQQAGGMEFFGGDLAGIIQQLDYLQELGVNALYLNPIFTAPSNHKYDCMDYYQVDPHLGGNAALAALRSALDKRDMRLVLDVVVNHCGSSHPWFTAAQADASAHTVEFFTFKQHPHQYACWLGVRSLPKLNYRSERLREQIYSGTDAVLRHWLRPPYNIDGWRIDVANMLARQGESQLGHKIGRSIRRVIKAEFPNAYLLGEHFHDGTPHLQGDELDAGMNYSGFTFPVLQWLAGYNIADAFAQEWATNQPLPTEVMAEQMTAFRSVTPWQIAIQQFNLLGSHDTPRLLNVVNQDEACAKVAVTLLFTYPGVPCIYYGDEIGLTGNLDPDNRACMKWDRSEWHNDIYHHHQVLVQLRRTAAALRWGGFQLLYAYNQTLAFLREAHEQRLIVVIRRNKDNLTSLPVAHGAIADGTHMYEFFSGNETTVINGMLSLDGLAATDAQIWFVNQKYHR